MYCLALTTECYAALTRLALPGIVPIRLEDFEKDDEPLADAKANRSQIEYFFTCTPSLLRYVLRIDPAVDLITYLDADLYFFADPSRVMAEMGTGSIAIIPHRFPPSLRHYEEFGIFNVGWVSFRRDANAMQCLEWWRDRCNEWCYDRLEPDRFGDQKYLDKWPSLFKGVVVLHQKGANLGPWNASIYTIRKRANGIHVDEDPLVFFHFHGFKHVTSWLCGPHLSHYGLRASRSLLRNVFTPYHRSLRITMQQVRPLLMGRLAANGIRYDQTQSATRRSLKEIIKQPLRRYRDIALGLRSGRYVWSFSLGGH